MNQQILDLITQINEKLDKMETGFDEIQEKLDKNFGAPIDKLSQYDNEFESINGHLSRIEDTISRIEAGQQEIIKELKK